MKKIGIYTARRTLYTKLLLLMRDTAEVYWLCNDDDTSKFDIIFADIDTYEAPACSHIGMSRSFKADITLPFDHEEILKYVRENGSDDNLTISLNDRKRTVTVSGTKVRLSITEYRIMRELYGACGAYISKDELASRVWDTDIDGGNINVHIFNIRKKLERNGERIILSSKNVGYAINKKYRRIDDADID